jgi:hypothetical protein
VLAPADLVVSDAVLGYGMTAAAHVRRGSEDMAVAASPLASSPMGSTLSSSPMGSPHYQSHGGRDYDSEGYAAMMMGGAPSLHGHPQHHHQSPYPHPVEPMAHPQQQHQYQHHHAPRYAGAGMDLYPADASAAVREGWPSQQQQQQQPQAGGDYADYYTSRGPPPQQQQHQQPSHAHSASGYYPSLMGLPALSFPPADQMAAAVAVAPAPLYVGSSSSSNPSEAREAQTPGVLVPIARHVSPESAVAGEPAEHGPGPGKEPPEGGGGGGGSSLGPTDAAGLRGGHLRRTSSTTLFCRATSPPPRLPDDAWAAIPGLLEYYWRTIHNLVSIVHPVTFERTHGRSVVLRCAMGVLASQMRATREDMAWGVQMYEYAWPMCVEEARGVSKEQHLSP